MFWLRFGYSAPPKLAGKRVLEVGSGLGSFAAAAAISGAKIVALEPVEEVAESSKALISDHIDAATNGSNAKVDVVCSLIENYSTSIRFDYILCNEVFEHLVEFPKALGSMERLLAPGGKLITGWGPLWHSPYGGHAIMLYLSLSGPLNLIPKIARRSPATKLQVQLPFSHRIFTAYAMKLFRESRKKDDWESIQDIGMNGLTRGEFQKIISDTSLTKSYWKENQGDRLYYQLLRLVSKLPGLKNTFTSNVYAILTKPEAS